MHAGLIVVLSVHRRSVASEKHNGGYLIAVHSGVDGNDTGYAGLPMVYPVSSESIAPFSPCTMEQRRHDFVPQASCLHLDRRTRKLKARVTFLFLRFLLSCLAYRTDRTSAICGQKIASSADAEYDPLVMTGRVVRARRRV